MKQKEFDNMTKEINLRDVARKYYDGGLNVLPATSKKKCPLGKWKEFIQARPAFDVAFPAGIQFDALFVVCGTTSGGLTVLDFDQSGLKYDDWRELNDLDLIGNLPNETTQHDGRHVAFRSENCGKGEKLASNAAGVTIETRGEGQGVIVAPSADYAMNWGNWANVPTISDDQRRRLIETARSLDESPKKPATSKKNATKTTTKATPFPSFPAGQSVADALRSDLGHVRDALTRNGWQFLRLDGDYEQWQRPGQEVEGKPGGSLCVNLNSELYGNFHCFTSNAAPLEIGKNYSPLRLIAALEHRGDESSAARTYSQHAPRKGQIVELINIEEQRYAEMAMNASGVEYSELDDPRAACYARQFKRLEEEAGKRARRSLEDIDVERLNESFPLDAIDAKPVRNLVEMLGRRQNLPFTAVACATLATAGGVVGCRKVKFQFRGREIYPMLHCCLVGEPKTGKTETMNSALQQVRIFSDKIRHEYQGKKWKKKKLEFERDKLSKEEGNDARLEEIENELLIIANQGPRMIQGAKSLESLQNQSYVNLVYAELKRIKPFGLIYTRDEAAGVYSASPRTINDLIEKWAAYSLAMDFNEDIATSVTRKEGAEKCGATFIHTIQIDLCKFVQFRDLLGQGYANRLLWCFLPFREKIGNVEYVPKLNDAQRDYNDLIERLIEYQGGEFEAGYEKEFDEWSEKIGRMISKSMTAGNKPKMQFLINLQTTTIHVLTLILHLCLFKGDGPRVIQPFIFIKATRLMEVFITEYDRTWRQMKLATAKGETTPATASTNPLDDLTPAARSVYEYVRANGEPLDKSDRAATITDIVDKGKQSAYRTRKKIGSGSTERERIDAELNEAGLMYVHRETGKRVALPVYTLDDLSGDLKEAKTESIALSERRFECYWKTDDQQQETIDAATTNEVSSERSDVEP